MLETFAGFTRRPTISHERENSPSNVPTSLDDISLMSSTFRPSSTPIEKSTHLHELIALPSSTTIFSATWTRCVPKVAIFRVAPSTSTHDIVILAANGADALVKLTIQKIVSFCTIFLLDSLVREACASPSIARFLSAEEAQVAAVEISGWLGRCTGENVSYPVELRIAKWWRSDQTYNDASDEDGLGD